MQLGNHGHYFRLDLSCEALEVREAPPHVYRDFIGGVGLAVRLLLEESVEADPLSPAAPLAFAFSPLVGSPLTTSAKFAVVARSPLTGRFNDSLVSSGFALAGKKTGADALILVGKAAQPSVLLIDDSGFQIQPADDLWGLACPAAEQVLRERYGAAWRFAVIGPAGEQRVPYASVSHDGRHAGRGGHGAVLGAKNLKAIGVRGDKNVRWAEPDRLVALAKDLSQRSFGPATAKYRELGTAANLLAFNRLNCLPSANFRDGALPGVEALSPEAMMESRKRTRTSCAACTIGCEHIYQLDSKRSVRVEYENLFALGSLCGVVDPEAVLAASVLCDEMGLDTISTGGSIAFAMECAQEGLLDIPWLQFGSGEALLRAINLIGKRDGEGALLAKGVRAMSAEIGQGSEAYAAHVKGLEMPGYEPRGVQTLALGMAVGARGADHNRSGAYEADFSAEIDRRSLGPQSAQLAAESEDRAAIMDSLILCKFVRRALNEFYPETAEMLSLATGFAMDAEELRRVAARIISAKKEFNQRTGWTCQEDRLPRRFLNTPLPSDPKAVIDSRKLSVCISNYYALRGWDSQGRILPANFLCKH